MVTKEDLAKIRTIVECVYAELFGGHETDLTLTGRVDHYGYDVVDVVLLSDETPPGLGGRRSVEFRGRVNDRMVEEGVLIDLIFRFRLREEVEAVMAEQAAGYAPASRSTSGAEYSPEKQAAQNGPCSSTAVTSPSSVR